MLSSFPFYRGGDKQGQSGKKGNQQGQQTQKKPDSQVFVPPKFHGYLTDDDHELVQIPKTFEIPFGVMVDAIFDHIRVNKYTEIEPVLRKNYDLTSKLFNEVYVDGILSIYYGNTKAVKGLQDQIVIGLQTVGTPTSRGAASYIKTKVQTSTFLEKIRESINEELDAVYGDKFDTNANDKANAILSLDMKKWIASFLKKISNLITNPPRQTQNPSSQGSKKQKKGKQKGGASTCETSYPIVFSLLKNQFYKNESISDFLNNIAKNKPLVQEFLVDLEFEDNKTVKRKVLGEQIAKLLKACHPDKNIGDETIVQQISATLTTIAKADLSSLTYVKSSTPVDSTARTAKFTATRVPESSSRPKPSSRPKFSTPTLDQHREKLKKKILTDDCGNSNPETVKDSVILDKTKEAVIKYLNAGFKVTISYLDAAGTKQTGILETVLFTDEERAYLVKLKDILIKLQSAKARYADFYTYLIQPFCEFIKNVGTGTVPSDPKVYSPSGPSGPSGPKRSSSSSGPTGPTTSSSSSGPSGPSGPKTKDDPNCGYFEFQDNAASCGRHALNNVFGERKFIKISDDPSATGPIPVIRLDTPTLPVDLPNLCKKLTTESKKVGIETDLFECKYSEYYNITTLQFALYYAGVDFDEYPASKLTKFVNFLETSDETRLILNLGQITKNKSTGIHWVAAILGPIKYCYYDSLKDGPLNFATKEELIDHIVNLNITHVLVLKQSTTPIDIKAKLRAMVSGEDRSQSGDEKAIADFLNIFQDTYPNEYSTFSTAIESLYTPEGVVTGGDMSGGKYVGRRYVTSKPLTTAGLTEPRWYKIAPKSMNNLTPLQFAVGYGSVDSVRVLIRNGADFTVSTLNGTSLPNIANARKTNDFRAKDVKDLLKYVFAAYGAAANDYGAKKMKDDYVYESNLKEGEQKEKDLLNFVYTKTYKALKKEKSITEVLGEVGEKAKKKGQEDGVDGKKQDPDYTENVSQEVRDGYSLGYKMGQAERRGESDGLSKAEPTTTYDNNPDTDIRDAYRNAYNKAKGKDVYQGFKDGITGKEKSPSTSGFLDFDQSLASTLQFNKVDQRVVDDYEAGYSYGIQKFERELKNIIGNAENDGRLDGFNGKEQYSTKYIIKSKPLLGAIKNPGTPPTYRNRTEGEKQEAFEVNYGELDLDAKYATDANIQINVAKITAGVPTSGGNTAYGAYIQALYKYGYQAGLDDQEKKGGVKNKTYRKKRSSKSKTYKKKLVKK